MINKVIYENFKGKSETVVLTGRDLFAGSNGSGKTTIQQAIALAIQGYLPGGKKTAESVFQYATGTRMSVAVETDTGFQAKRAWEKNRTFDKKTGAESAEIAQTITVTPSNGERTNAQKEQRIAAELGCIPLMFDFNELDGMSDGKRRDFIYSVLQFDPGKYGIRFISEYITGNITGDIVDEFTADKTGEALRDILAKYPEAAPFEEALASVQDYAYAKTVEFKEKKTEATAAGKKLMDYKNQISATAKGIEEAKTARYELDGKIEETARRAGEMESQQKEAQRLRASIENEAYKIKCAGEEKTTATLQRERTKGEYKIINVDTVHAIPDYEQEIAELKQNINQASEMINELKSLEGQAIKEKEYAETARRKFEDEARTKRSQAAKLDVSTCPLLDTVTCPFDWSDTVANLNIQADADIEKANAWTSEAQKAAAERAKYNTKVAELNKTIEADEAKLEHYMKDQEHNRAQAERASEQVRKIDNQVAFWDGEIERALKIIDDCMETKAEREKELESIGRVDIEAIEANRTLLTGYKNRRSELQAEIDEKTRAKSTMENMLKATEEARTADTLYTAYKYVYDLLGPKGVQGQIVKDIVAPLENTITKRLQLIPKLNAHEFTFVTESDTGKEVFRYGWKDEKDNTVLFPALSTSEQGIMAAAILTTLVDSLSVGTRIFMADNIEHFDDDGRAHFLEALRLMAGDFDNIIVAGAITGIQAEQAKERGYTSQWVTR